MKVRIVPVDYSGNPVDKEKIWELSSYIEAVVSSSDDGVIENLQHSLEKTIGLTARLFEIFLEKSLISEKEFFKMAKLPLSDSLHLQLIQE